MNTMTCPSEEEWAEIDRRVRLDEKIRLWLLRLALFAVAMAVVFVLISYVASHSEAGRYDAWAQACEDYRHKNMKGK